MDGFIIFGGTSRWLGNFAVVPLSSDRFEWLINNDLYAHILFQQTIDSRTPVWYVVAVTASTLICATLILIVKLYYNSADKSISIHRKRFITRLQESDLQVSYNHNQCMWVSLSGTLGGLLWIFDFALVTESNLTPKRHQFDLQFYLQSSFFTFKRHFLHYLIS